MVAIKKMNSMVIKMFLLLAAALILPGCTDDELIQEKDRQISSYKVTVDDITQKNSHLNDEVDQLKSQGAQLKNEIKSIEQKVTSLLKENESLTDEKEELNQKLTVLGNDFSKTKQQAQDIKQLMEVEVASLKKQMDETVSVLQKSLTVTEKGLSEKNMKITELEGKLTVSILDKILFGVGTDIIKKDGLKVLEKIGTILKENSNKNIIVEGHTDNLPIKAPGFNPTYSNWELSAGRALNVVHFLQDTIGIPGERLSAACYGQYKPIVENTTKEGRAANRRIQIVLSAK